MSDISYLGYTDPEEFIADFERDRKYWLDKYSPPIPVVARAQLLGVGKAAVYDRFVLDLIDRDLLTMHTLADLHDIGKSMTPGLDRGAVASVMGLCAWSEGENLLAVGFALLSAKDDFHIGKVLADMIDMGMGAGEFVENLTEVRAQICNAAVSTFVTVGR